MRLLWILAGLASMGCNAFAGAEAELTGAGGTTTAAHGSGATSSASGKGGGSATSGASTSAGGSTTGSAGGGMENCTNGVDDDGNGLVDCDDPQCSDFECVDKPPQGWSMPGAFYYGIPDGVPNCPGNDPTLEVTAHGQIMGDGPDTCEMCMCGTRTGQSCGDVTTTIYSSAGCAGTATSSYTLTVSHCQYEFAPPSFEAKTDYVPGSCTAGGGSLTNTPTVTWGRLGRVCTPMAVGKCTNPNSVCAPKVGGEFGTSACISQTGDLTCPSSYPQKTILYSDFADNRGCSGCVCNTPPNDCTAALTYWQGGNNDCGATSLPGTPHSSTTGVCESMTNIESVKVTSISWPSAATQCTPVGGQPTGTVTATGPTTVCCR